MRCKLKHEINGRPQYPVLVFRIAALLVCLVLITTYLLSGAYSKFSSGASGGDSARVARFSPSFNSNEIIVSDKLPGYFKEIPFEVKNTSDDKVSEVAMKYKIVLKTTGNIPLTFTLFDSSGNPLGSAWVCNGTSGERTYEYTNDSLVFGVGTNEKDNYSLRIEWENTKNDAQFSGMTDAIYLSAEFEQID